MARMTIAALAAVLLLACGAHQAVAGRDLQQVTSQTVTCDTPRCPSGYTTVTTGTTAQCGYFCETSIKMNCPAGPARLARTCGGTTGKVCPSISCAYASTYAISGPLGCANARATVDAIAFSDVTYAPLAGILSPPIKEYCAGATAAGLVTPVEIAAKNAANAFAKTVAKTLVHYNQYVCSCCLGNSLAYSVVAADVQAVAIAQAKGAQSLQAQINCNGDVGLLAFAYAYTDAFARDVQLAIDSVNKYYVSGKNNFTCTPTGVQTEMEKAIAQATVCTFVQVFAAVIDSQSPGVTYACGDSISIAGGLLGQAQAKPHVCPLFPGCPCTPEAYQYTNLGFENGVFEKADGTSVPAWFVVDNGINPAVIQQENLKIGTSMVTLKPAEGSYFAVVPAGSPGASTISAEITVPPCAKNVTAQYVFKCNGRSGFDDAASVTLKLTDKYNPSIVITNTKLVDCSDVGYNSADTCSGSDSSVENGGASGTPAGSWSPISINNIASGVYYLDITATAKELGLPGCAAKLYVDDIRFV